MAKTTTLERSLHRLGNNAERLQNDAPKTFGSEWMPGDVAAQGDVILVCLCGLPASIKKRSNRQLAEGATQGSRHILVGGRCYDADPEEVAGILKKLGYDVQPRYIGPVFESPCSLKHPEHGDHVYTAPGVFAVVYQRVLDAEMREQRAAD